MIIEWTLVQWYGGIKIYAQTSTMPFCTLEANAEAVFDFGEHSETFHMFLECSGSLLITYQLCIDFYGCKTFSSQTFLFFMKMKFWWGRKWDVSWNRPGYISKRLTSWLREKLSTISGVNSSMKFVEPNRILIMGHDLKNRLNHGFLCKWCIIPIRVLIDLAVE